MKNLWIPQGVVTLMLLWALNPDNPYGYYMLLRWVCCGAFMFLATRAATFEAHGWTWAFGIMAGIYNPIIPVHLNRQIWSVVNVITIIVAVASVFVLEPKNEREQ